MDKSVALTDARIVSSTPRWTDLSPPGGSIGPRLSVGTTRLSGRRRTSAETGRKGTAAVATSGIDAQHAWGSTPAGLKVAFGFQDDRWPSEVA